MEKQIKTDLKFTDQNGKSKTVRIFKDKNGIAKEGHTGNSNYISNEAGDMIHHNAAKIVKRTMHACKMYKRM